MLASTAGVRAEEKQEPVSAERARNDFARPVVLAADDVRAFADPAAGFDVRRADGPAGKVEGFEYESSVTGTRRSCVVYLPPNYSPERRYPVLYLLHGIGGNQHEWTGYVRADVVLDNLIPAGKATPMIVVMPNGRALADDSPPPSDKTFTPEHTVGFERFEQDLLECLIPAIDAHYPTLADRMHRALAGLSMGGGQSLNFGLAHLDTFAWVGGFSSAPNTKPSADLVPDPKAVRDRLALLYLSCGNKDGLISVSQRVHVFLKENKIPHIWNVDDSAHDRDSWSANLHHFAQRIFR